MKISILSVVIATVLSATSSYCMQQEKVSEDWQIEVPIHCSSLSESNDELIENIENLKKLDAAAVQQIIIDKEQESGTSDARPALYIAALHSKELLEWVFERHPQMNINAIDQIVGWTALHAACSWGQAEAVEWLLCKDAQLDVVDSAGMTPFMLAVYGGHSEVVRILASKKAVVDVRDETKSTALHIASYGGDVKLVALLLEINVPIDALDKNGSTALHLASYKGAKAVVELLLAARAQTDLARDEGLTALHLAAGMGHTDVVALLLDKNPHLLNIQSKDGSTALHLAASAGSVTAVEVLLARKARIDLLDCEKRTPADRAAQRDRFKVFTILWNKSKVDTLKKFLGL